MVCLIQGVGFNKKYPKRFVLVFFQPEGGGGGVVSFHLQIYMYILNSSIIVFNTLELVFDRPASMGRYTILDIRLLFTAKNIRFNNLHEYCWTH